MFAEEFDVDFIVTLGFLVVERITTVTSVRMPLHTRFRTRILTQFLHDVSAVDINANVKTRLCL
jgi:hypothetical protein